MPLILLFNELLGKFYVLIRTFNFNEILRTFNEKLFLSFWLSNCILHDQ